MDKSSDNLHTRVVHNTSDHDSSDDDLPLSMFQKKPKNDDKQVCMSTHCLTLNSNSNSGKDRNGEEKKTSKTYTNLSGHDSSDDDVPLIKFLKKQKDDEHHEKREGPTLSSVATNDGSADTSDDEPLSKIKKRLPAKKPGTNQMTTTSSNSSHRTKKTAVDSSDDEPLIKSPKVSSKTAETCVDAHRKEPLDDDVSSDDEPLSELAKRLMSQRRTKALLMPSRKTTLVKKCKREAPKTLESSSDSSDDEPPIQIKKRRTKSRSEEKVSTNCRKTKPNAKGPKTKDPSSSDDSSDDDVPLANLTGKHDKPVRKTTVPAKKTTVSRTTIAARKKRGISSESSDDEPLINLVKKPLRDATNTTPATTSTKKTLAGETAPSASKPSGKTAVSSRKTGSGALNKGSSSDSSDDEPLIKTATNPQQKNPLLMSSRGHCQTSQKRRHQYKQY
ncbi:uncharacterized protein ACJ7VT_022672 isoform 2-T2 [Polymixia lowei]